MKYGKAAVMSPRSACSSGSMSAAMARNRAGVMGVLRYFSSSATKRDMCVPFSSAGSATVRVQLATVPWGAPSPPWISMGWRTPRIPTRWIGMCRVSAELWTSGITMAGSIGEFISAYLSRRTAVNMLGAWESR